MKTCFVVCPIGSENTDTRRRSDQVFKHIIMPVCEANGFKGIRVDMINDSDAINQTIIDHLHNSDLVISDLTDHNPNAYYETGIRQALKKPLIHIMEVGGSLPFDVSGTRTIFYNLLDLDKVEEVKNRLSETIKAVCINKEDNDDLNQDEVSSTPQSQRTVSQIFSLLLDIKDSLDNMRTDLTKKDKSDMEHMISVLVKQFQTNQFSPEQRLMELMVPEMINNPAKFANFASFIKQAQTDK